MHKRVGPQMSDPSWEII